MDSSKKTVVVGDKYYPVPDEIVKSQIYAKIVDADGISSKWLDGEQVYISKVEPSTITPLLNTTTTTAHYYLYFNRNKSLPSPLSVIKRGFEWHDLANFFAQYAFPYNSGFNVGSKFSLFLNRENTTAWIRNSINYKNDFLSPTGFPIPVLTNMESYESNLDKILEDSKIPGKKYPLETDDKVLRHTEGFTNARLRELSWYAFWYGGFKVDATKDNPFIMVSLDGNECSYSNLNKILIDSGKDDYVNDFTTSTDINRTLGDSKTINRVILNVAFRSTQLLPFPPSSVNINTYLYNFATNKWEYVDAFHDCAMIIIQRMVGTLRDLFDNKKFDELENLGFKVREDGVLIKIIEDVSKLMLLPIIFVKDFDNYISPNTFVEYAGEQYINWARAMYHASQGEISYQEVPELNSLLSNKFLVGFSLEESKKRDMSSEVLFICADHRTGAELPFSFMEQIEQSSLVLGLPYFGYEAIQLVVNGLLEVPTSFGIDIAPMLEMFGVYNIDNDTIFSANSKKRYTAEYIKNDVIPNIKSTNDKVNALKNDAMDILKEFYNGIVDAFKGLTDGSSVSGKVSGVLGSIFSALINAVVSGLMAIVSAVLGIISKILEICKKVVSLIEPLTNIVVWIVAIIAIGVACLFTAAVFTVVLPAAIDTIGWISPMIGTIVQVLADVSLGLIIDGFIFAINIINKMVSSISGDGSGSLGNAISGAFGMITDMAIRVIRFIIQFLMVIFKLMIMIFVKILPDILSVGMALIINFIDFLGYLTQTGDGWVTPNKHYISYGGKYDVDKLPYLETDVFTFGNVDNTSAVYIPETVIYPSEIYEDEEGKVLLPQSAINRILGSRPFNGKIYIRSSKDTFSNDTTESELPYVELPYDEELVLLSESPYVEKRALTFLEYAKPSLNLYNQIKIELEPQQVSCISLPLFRNKVINVEYPPFKTVDIVFKQIPIIDGKSTVTISFGVPKLMTETGKVDISLKVPLKLESNSKVDILVNVGTVSRSSFQIKANVVLLKTSESKVDAEVMVEPIPASQSSVNVKISAYKQAISSRFRIQCTIAGKSYAESNLKILFDKYNTIAYFVPTKFIAMLPGSNSVFILVDVMKIGENSVPAIFNIIKENKGKVDITFSSFAESKNKVDIVVNCYKESVSSRFRMAFDAQKESSGKINIYFEKYLEYSTPINIKFDIVAVGVSSRFRMVWVT
jgi:hypothetical protein